MARSAVSPAVSPPGARHVAGGAGARPLGPWRRTVREVGLAMVTGGVVVLLFVAYQLWGTGIAEHDAQHRLAGDFRAAVGQAGRSAAHAGRSGSGAGRPGSPASPTSAPARRGAPPGGDNPTVGSSGRGRRGSQRAIPAGGVVAHLVIPSIDVNTYVVQGTAERDLSQGPGHYTGTPLPGQAGNAAIAGHRTTYGAPFYRLGQLAARARIDLTDTAGCTWVYRVARRLVVSPTDVSVLDPTSRAVLTLTTCNPPFSAANRLVIRADLVGRARTPARRATSAPPATSRTGAAGARAPATTARTPATPAGASAPAAANLGEGSSSAWTPTVLWGLLFVLLWVGTRVAVARTRRWARGGAFLGGAVVCAVPLWLCFHSIVHLLPANI